MTLDHVLTARKAYDKALKETKTLKKDVGARLAAHIPQGMLLEWNQDDMAVDSPVIFPEKIRVSSHDGLPIKGKADDAEANWAKGDPFDGFRLSDGVSKYHGEFAGLTRKQLGALIKSWAELPTDLLIRIFGNAAVRVTPKGKVTVTR
jgi:hypothetical protein